MDRKGIVWLALAGFVLFTFLAALWSFPRLENELNSKASELSSFNSLEDAELEWNGRNGYLSVPVNTDKDAAESAADDIEGIQGVRNVKVIYDESKVLKEETGDVKENNEDVKEEIAEVEVIEKSPGKFTLNWTAEDKNISGALDEDSAQKVEDIFGVAGLNIDEKYVLSDNILNKLGGLGKNIFTDLIQGMLSVDGDNIKLSGIAASSEGFDELKAYLSGIEGMELDLEMPEITEEELVQEEIDKLLALGNIEFEYGGNRVTAETKPLIDDIAQILLDNEEVQVNIIGHTDSKGGAVNNMNLSKVRARTVYNLLAEKGVDEARMSYDGKGETAPIADNETDEGRQKNRRVEILVKGNE